MNFLHELKRRRVVRVAVVYAATAFVILQAADLLAAGLALPSWVFAAITLVTVLGFPLALVLVWAFQITPDGMQRRTTDPREPDRWLSARTIAAVVVAVALVAAGGWFLRPAVSAQLARSAARGGMPEGPAMLSLLPPVGEAWDDGATAFAVSPDGRSVAIVTAPDGPIVLRDLDGLGTSRLPHTAGGSLPFWSPDGRSLGFFAGAQLRVLDLESGVARALCPAARPRGASWGQRNVILYTPVAGDALHRTYAGGGACERVPLVGSAAGVTGRPFSLGDGRHYVLSGDGQAWLGGPGTDSLTLLLRDVAGMPVGAPPDYLLFRARSLDGAERPLLAQRIDLHARRMTGEPRRLLERVSGTGAGTALSATTSVMVVLGPGAAPYPLLHQVGPGGAVLDSLVVPAENVRPSRDGRRIAIAGGGLWIHERDRRVTTRVADTPGVRFLDPVWAPQDSLIAFEQVVLDGGTRRYSIVVFDTRSARLSVLLEGDGFLYLLPQDWSPDGRFLAFRAVPSGSALSQAFVYDAETGAARPLFDDPGFVEDMRISPDGGWIAWQSNGEGAEQVYLRPFDAPGPALRVSADGGRWPRWREDGQELYFAAPDGDVMAVTVRATGELAGFLTPTGALGRPVGRRLRGLRAHARRTDVHVSDPPRHRARLHDRARLAEAAGPYRAPAMSRP